VLNGAGECTGFIGVSEWGLLETPVFLTSTMQVGRVYDAACELLMAEHPEIGAEDVIIPMVAECDDSWLSDARSMQVSAGDVKAALSAARSSGAADEKRPPAEGAVGAGTGMTCLGFKGGIGTSSRVLPSAFMLGVLVLTNFGDDARLTIDGLPVGRILGAAGGKPPPRPQSGSCIVVIATDAPLDAAACTRLARRAGLGLARTGSTGHHGSGEIFVALSTGLRRPRRAGPPPAAPLGGSQLDLYFDAAVEATEEAVLNSLFAARTVTGRDGNTSPGLPVDDVLAMLEQAGRLTGRSE
jgi:D-aminopeptidase